MENYIKIKPKLTSCKSCLVTPNLAECLCRGDCRRPLCSQGAPGHRSPEESLCHMFLWVSSHCFSTVLLEVSQSLSFKHTTHPIPKHRTWGYRTAHRRWRLWRGRSTYWQPLIPSRWMKPGGSNAAWMLQPHRGHTDPRKTARSWPGRPGSSPVGPERGWWGSERGSLDEASWDGEGDEHGGGNRQVRHRQRRI